MYNNIGVKIKGLAKALFIINLIGIIVIGIYLISDGEDEIGLPILIIGPIFAWVSTWLLYGFGELIAKVSDIAENTRKDAGNATSQPRACDKNKLEELRAQNLITEEEYIQTISKNN